MLIFTNYGLSSKSFASDILVIVIMQHASDIVSVNRGINFIFQETEAESYPTMSWPWRFFMNNDPCKRKAEMIPGQNAETQSRFLHRRGELC